MHDKNDPRIKQLSAVYAMVTGQDGTPVTRRDDLRRAVPTLLLLAIVPGQKGLHITDGG